MRFVAEALDWGATKLLRIETGASHITTVDLRVLLQFYGVHSQAEIDELVGVARYARRALFNSYSDVMTPQFFTYLQYESASRRIMSFQPLLIPGLLQTEEYAYAVLRLGPQLSDGEYGVERLVQARLERQERLLAGEGPELLFILDEAALCRHIGGREAMCRQLEHLLVLANLPQVELQVLPFERGEHVGILGSFVVLEFPAPEDEPIAFVEGPLDGLVVQEDLDEVTLYIEMFLDLQKLAVPATEVATRIEATLERMRG